MKKDFIMVDTSDGKKAEAELVCKYSIQNLGNYVIYKIDGEYYGAKYEQNEDNISLITDLNDKEIKILDSILESIEE